MLNCRVNSDRGGERERLVVLDVTVIARVACLLHNFNSLLLRDFAEACEVTECLVKGWICMLRINSSLNILQPDLVCFARAYRNLDTLCRPHHIEFLEFLLNKFPIPFRLDDTTFSDQDDAIDMQSKLNVYRFASLPPLPPRQRFPIPIADVSININQPTLCSRF